MQESFYFTSSTKEKIHARIWKNDNIKEYRGIVQLVHGMQEYIGRYDEFAQVLANNSYIVVGHDHLGHGDTAMKDEDFGYFAKKDGWNHLAEDVHILQNKKDSRGFFSWLSFLGFFFPVFICRRLL